MAAMSVPAAGAPPRPTAARAASDRTWVAAWGYVVSPPPPGQQPAPFTPPAGTVVPLGPASAPASPPTPPRLLENPGEVPVDTGTGDLVNATIRQVVRVSVAGSAVRLRLSNEGGVDVLAIGAMHVGLAGPDGSVLPGTDHIVTFAGLPGTNIPAGAPLLSDPIMLPVKALDRLAISLYAPGRLPVRNVRALWQYVAGPSGDSGAMPVLSKVRLVNAPVILTQVEVAPTQPTSVVVALGDSITEGYGSTNNAFRGWTDRLAERLAARPGRQRWAVLNAGIGGNRLLGYGAGPNALARFDRDVLSVPGVKAVILLEGINDIGRSFSPRGASDPVTADALIAADKQIIERAHEQGIRVIGATLTPYKNAGYASEQGEAVRQALNNWIRSSGAFDGVIDFASSVADKTDPLAIASVFNDGDKLHPNDAGYKAMADAADLQVITGM
ncbi:lysophospholipase L1-like esterase [Sphingomonas sp. PP-CE-1A-559]|nr:lysophospholipase L1-like esterase [Sphingomonas sp. PP-CE-1A-559]